MRDFDFVKRALENKENRKEHIMPLQKLIDHFRLMHPREVSYYIHLSSMLTKLDDRLFDQHIENIRNGSKN